MNPHVFLSDLWSWCWRVALTAVLVFLLYAIWHFSFGGSPDQAAQSACEDRMEDVLNASVQRMGETALAEYSAMRKFLPESHPPSLSYNNASYQGWVEEPSGRKQTLFFSPLGGVMSYESQRAREKGYSVYPFSPNTIVSDEASWGEKFRRSAALAVLPRWEVSGESGEDGEVFCHYSAHSSFANPFLMLFRGILSFGGASREVEIYASVKDNEIHQPRILGEDIYQQVIAALTKRSSTSNEVVDYVVNADAIRRQQEVIRRELSELKTGAINARHFSFETFQVKAFSKEE